MKVFVVGFSVFMGIALLVFVSGLNEIRNRGVFLNAEYVCPITHE